MHPGYLSNAYVVADRPAGTAVFVDSGAPLEPLLVAVEREHLTVTHVLTTHGHHDHVEGHDELQRRFGVPAIAESVETGGLSIQALPTPGHSDDGVSFVVNDEVCFSGDTLFKDAVGGTRDDFAAVRRSVMDVLMPLPPETRVLPGHTDETTIGREWEHNPFVRVGAAPIPRARSRAASAARRRRSSSGRPTTTARARRGCGLQTDVTRSSAARVCER